MTTPNPILVAGIDVGKAKLDVHIAEGSLERQFHNDKCGRRALRNWLLKRAVTGAVLESTGRYHRNLHQCLCDAGIETVVVNPLRSRRFAEALGLFAKNDRVDAAIVLFPTFFVGFVPDSAVTKWLGNRTNLEWQAEATARQVAYSV